MKMIKLGESVWLNLLFHKQLKRLKRGEKTIIATKNTMVVLSLTASSRKKSIKMKNETLRMKNE